MKNKNTIIYILIILLIIPTIAMAKLEITIPESHKEVLPGEEILTSVKIINFENVERIDVVLEVFIINSEQIYVEGIKETVAIQTQANFVKTIKIPEQTPPGRYKAIVKITYANREYIEAEDTFRIIEEENKKIMKGIYITSAIIIIGIIIILFTLYTIKKRILKMRIKRIVKKRTKK